MLGKESYAFASQSSIRIRFRTASTLQKHFVGFVFYISLISHVNHVPKTTTIFAFSLLFPFQLHRPTFLFSFPHCEYHVPDAKFISIYQSQKSQSMQVVVKYYVSEVLVVLNF